MHIVLFLWYLCLFLTVTIVENMCNIWKMSGDFVKWCQGKPGIARGFFSLMFWEPWYYTIYQTLKMCNIARSVCVSGRGVWGGADNNFTHCSIFLDPPLTDGPHFWYRILFHLLKVTRLKVIRLRVIRLKEGNKTEDNKNEGNKATGGGVEPTIVPFLCTFFVLHLSYIFLFFCGLSYNCPTI